MERNIKRGDIYYANLDPVVGSEQNGSRPVLIISNNTGNKYSSTAIVAAITSRIKASHRTHVKVAAVHDLPQDSIVLLEQIRTLDKQRLEQYIGTMPNNIMARVEKALAISILAKRTRKLLIRTMDNHV